MTIDLFFQKLAGEDQTVRAIHGIASLFGAIFLLLMWHHARKGITGLKRDWGLVLLAVGLMMWCFMDAYKFADTQFNEGKNSKGMIVVIISIFNNAFFLASLSYFEHAFRGIKKRFSRFHAGYVWPSMVILINVVFICIPYMLFWKVNEENILLEYFEFFYSITVLGLLGYAITASFRGRSQYGRAFIFMSILITFLLMSTQSIFAPFFKSFLTKNDLFDDIPSLILHASHMALIALLLVLAQSWIEEKQIKNQKQTIEKLKHKIRKLEQNINTKRELTDREEEILSLIYKTAQQTSSTLNIAENTVNSHIKSIKSKLGISSKIELEKYAKNNHYY